MKSLKTSRGKDKKRSSIAPKRSYVGTGPLRRSLGCLSSLRPELNVTEAGLFGTKSFLTIKTFVYIEECRQANNAP